MFEGRKVRRGTSTNEGCGLWVNQTGMEPKHVAKLCELWNRPTAVRMLQHVTMGCHQNHLKTSASCQLPAEKEGKDLSRGRAERKEGLQSGTKVPKMATRTIDGCRRRKVKGGGEHFQGQTVNEALAIHIIIFVLLCWHEFCDILVLVASALPPHEPFSTWHTIESFVNIMQHNPFSPPFPSVM